ncbi:MAG: hypothetical protein ABIO04_03530 [Ferruginibacter sp.]
MSKQLLSVLLFCAIASPSFSQSFMHGAGIGLFVGTTSAAGGQVAVAEGFIYSPRFNFFETENLSVSVGIPLSLGLSASTSYNSGNYYAEELKINLLVNAPLIFNLNMGRGSTKQNRTKFGYFVGAGYGFYHGDFYGIFTDELDPTYEYLGSRSLSIHGPAANAGMRFGVGKKHKNIELRFSYMKGINETKPNIFGIAGLFNF